MLRTSNQDAKHIQVVQTQFLSTCEVVKSLNKQTHTVHVYLYWTVLFEFDISIIKLKENITQYFDIEPIKRKLVVVYVDLYWQLFKSMESYMYHLPTKVKDYF